MGRLELTWIGKDLVPRLEPRILLPDDTLSYVGKRIGEATFDNKLIFGDNLLALKALEQEYTGKVKCIFIDPPYNTGSAFEHYDDGLEHSIWLTMMRDRLAQLKRLLSPDGSLWMTIDDNEAHYLKVISDEVFGRPNFVANVIWQKKFSPQNDAKWLSDMHDHVLVYAKDKSSWRPNRLLVQSKTAGARRNIDDDPRGPWISVDYTCNKNRFERPNLYYGITNPTTGQETWPKETAVWRFSQERHEQNVINSQVYWGKDGTNRVPRFKNFASVLSEDQVPATIWPQDEVGNTQEARKESLQFNQSDPFATPKPERLLGRILQLATDRNDIVLDSFGGSGTTGAVAHKMGRRWIMIELGEHCHTHIIPRLEKVIDGTDPGGISKAVGWKGGGGFRYLKLAPSLLEKDKYGQWVINPEYNPAMLAEAMCKHEGYVYDPSETLYWMHGHSTETDFIYVTTQTLSQLQLAALSDELGTHRTLLICCKAWTGATSSFSNLTVKKIPNAVLHKCEFGRDDYSLKVSELPEAEPEPPEPTSAGQQSAATDTPNLFDVLEPETSQP